MQKIVHSGGTKGSDSLFSKIFDNHGYNVIHHSFKGHNINAKTGKSLIHSTEELKTKNNVQILKKLCLFLEKNYPKKEYIEKLLLRNIFQVKETNLILAISNILNFDKGIIEGGTGYAVAYGIINCQPILIFDQKNQNWFYSKDGNPFQLLNRKPIFEKLPNVFTAIGSRELSKESVNEMYNCFSKKGKISDISICSYNN